MLQRQEGFGTDASSLHNGPGMTTPTACGDFLTPTYYHVRWRCLAIARLGPTSPFRLLFFILSTLYLYHDSKLVLAANLMSLRTATMRLDIDHGVRMTRPWATEVCFNGAQRGNVRETKSIHNVHLQHAQCAERPGSYTKMRTRRSGFCFAFSSQT